MVMVTVMVNSSSSSDTLVAAAFGGVPLSLKLRAFEDQCNKLSTRYNSQTAECSVCVLRVFAFVLTSRFSTTVRYTTPDVAGNTFRLGIARIISLFVSVIEVN